MSKKLKLGKGVIGKNWNLKKIDYLEKMILGFTSTLEFESIGTLLAKLGSTYSKIIGRCGRLFSRLTLTCTLS